MGRSTYVRWIVLLFFSAFDGSKLDVCMGWKITISYFFAFGVELGEIYESFALMAQLKTQKQNGKVC